MLFLHWWIHHWSRLIYPNPNDVHNCRFGYLMIWPDFLSVSKFPPNLPCTFLILIIQSYMLKWDCSLSKPQQNAFTHDMKDPLHPPPQGTHGSLCTTAHHIYVDDVIYHDFFDHAHWACYCIKHRGNFHLTQPHGSIPLSGPYLLQQTGGHGHWTTKSQPNEFWWKEQRKLFVSVICLVGGWSLEGNWIGGLW